MRISNYAELVEFLKTNYDYLSNSDYIELMSSTLGVYENTKSKDLDKLIERITQHGRYLEQQPLGQERPLFWITKNEGEI